MSIYMSQFLNLETYANDQIVEYSILPLLSLCWHGRNEKGYERDIGKKSSHCSTRRNSAENKEDLEAGPAQSNAPPNMYAFFFQDFFVTLFRCFG